MFKQVKPHLQIDQLPIALVESADRVLPAEHHCRGLSDQVPVGFQAIRLRFVVDGEVEPDRLKRLKERAERYCVVLQTLLAPPRIDATWATG